MCSIYNLVAITVSQYLDVVYPTSNITQYWKKYPIIVISLPWIIGLSFHVYFDIFHATIIENGCYAIAVWSSETEFKGAVVYLLVTHAFLPIILFCIVFPQMTKRLNKPKSSSGKVKLFKSHIFWPIQPSILIYCLCQLYFNVYKVLLTDVTIFVFITNRIE